MRYVAFLGGMNVGGHRIKMADLCGLFTAMKFTGVSSFIASGNVIFESRSKDTAAIERTIESRLQESLGYAVPTFVRTPPEIEFVVQYRPFPAAEMEAPGHSLHVCFLRRPPGPDDAEAMLAFRTAMDDFHVQGRELYWLCRGRITESLVKWPAVNKRAALRSTARNITMLRRLLPLCNSPA